VNKEESTVYDFKFPGFFKYKRVVKKDYDCEKNEEPYLLQLACYAMFLKMKNFELIFFSRDDFSSVSFKFKTKDWVDRVDEELAVLNGFIEQKRLPPANPRAYSGKDCNYCKYADHCKDVEVKRFVEEGEDGLTPVKSVSKEKQEQLPL